MYDVCLEYTDILAGTSNKYAKTYLEVSKNMETSKEKNMRYVENFVKSIEEINKKCGKDTRISSSKGNIKEFKGYKDITTVVDYFKTSGSSVEGFKDLVTIKDSLEQNQALYTEAYNKGVRVLILEYETALYMLVTGLSLLMATNVDVSNDKILIQKKTGASGGVILKTCKQFAKELSGSKHKSYMDGLIKVSDSSKENKGNTPAEDKKDDKPEEKKEETKDTNVNESVFYEDMAGVSVLVASTLTLFDNIVYHISTIPTAIRGIARSIKKTFFGIIPLIRCGLYIKYKKKADTIVALEQQAEFLQKNIERLKRRTNIDPKEKDQIIKRQEAYVKAYLKKAEKLRAQLMETEKEASTALAKEDPKMSDTSNDGSKEGSTDDGDFILEGTSIRNHFKKGNKSLSKADFIKKRLDEVKSIKPHGSKESFRDTLTDKDPNKHKKLEAILREIVTSTEKDSIRFTLKSRLSEDNDTKGRMKSKIGGIPYWPKDKEWPTYNGKPLLLLAQINFSDVPNLPGFPSSGILEFFTGDTTEWGYRGHENETKVVYFEKPDSKIEQLEEIPMSSCDSEATKYDLPFTGVFYIDKFIREKISMQVMDEDFNDVMKNAQKKYPELSDREVFDYVFDNYPHKYDHRIGGWDYHTQSDPKTSKYNTMLLQIDTDRTEKDWNSQIVWGDNGIANIFINDQALKSKNFSDVMFYWDCY